jgi:hypothetical protein
MAVKSCRCPEGFPSDFWDGDRLDVIFKEGLNEYYNMKTRFIANYLKLFYSYVCV